MKVSMLVGRLVCLFSILPVLSHALNVTVINTSDSGAGSLRQAISDVNASVDAMNVIDFNITGTPPHTISPSSFFPSLTKPVLIDGFSQPGYVIGVPAVVIDYAGAGSFVYGLSLDAEGSTIRGLRIKNCTYSGVRIAGSGCTVAGCHSVSNTDCGVYLINTTGCTVGGTDEADRNVLSANDYAGIFISGGHPAPTTPYWATTLAWMQAA